MSPVLMLTTGLTRGISADLETWNWIPQQKVKNIHERAEYNPPRSTLYLHTGPRSRKIVIWAFQLYLTTTNDWFKFKMHYLHVKTNYNILTSKRKFYRKKQYVPRHLPKINRVTVPENPEWSIIFLPNGPIWMLVERISSALLCCIRHGRHSVSGWSLISCCRQHAARILTRTDLCHHTSGVSALNTFVESFKHRQKLLKISMLKWLKD